MRKRRKPLTTLAKYQKARTEGAFQMSDSLAKLVPIERERHKHVATEPTVQCRSSGISNVITAF